MPRRLLYGLPLWVALVVAFWIVAQGREGGAVELLEGILADLGDNPWALVGLMAAYLVRPLVVLPVTLLTAFAGFLLGPLGGVAFAGVGVLASASVAYAVARFLGAGRAPEGRWWRVLRRRSFEAIVVARLMLVPGDAVNYAAGAMRIDFVQFTAATALGGLPGLMVGVLAGASVEGAFTFSGVRLNSWYLIASLALLAASLLAASVLRRRVDMADPSTAASADAGETP